MEEEPEPSGDEGEASGDGGEPEAGGDEGEPSGDEGDPDGDGEQGGGTSGEAEAPPHAKKRCQQVCVGDTCVGVWRDCAAKVCLASMN